MESINPNLDIGKKKTLPSATEFVEGIIGGNRVLLSQAITLIESTRSDHQILAQEIIEKALPYSGNSIRIGITGTPEPDWDTAGYLGALVPAIAGVGTALQGFLAVSAGVVSGARR